ncbi:TonB family protein [uncultured Bacteroides sp.]|uniref:M56 family metallopeptidase n=1 Tax=uncultured Bacteroides sp. TaxID=162156 RepID=UPI002AAC4392|nr:TonB family protein [uncultured Bacteroides sp.]
MTPELAYFFKINIGIALFYAFYRLFFYRDTFFHWRRYALLSFLIISLLYPLMNFQDWVKEQEPMNEIVTIYAANILPEVGVTNQESKIWNQLIYNVGPAIYLIGVGVLFIRFLIQLISISILAIRYRKTKINGITVRILNKPSAPFSFFHWIFISPELHSEKEAKEILIHEETHARQWHSIDVMFSELITILCWVNPFSWLLKREIRNNLEYMADHRVILSGHDTKSYQYHLLGLANQKAAANLYNSFNVFPLKNRITMMNKKRTKSIGKTKYAMFIPLAVLLMLVSNIEAIARVTGKMTKDIAVSLTKNEVSSATEPSSLVAITQENDSAKPKKRNVFTAVEVMPQYPGGEQELLKFIVTNLKYPVEAQKAEEEGKVYVRFTVTENGYVEDPTILRSVSPLLDNEAKRIISSMPKWIPGKQSGKNVSVYYVIPIMFKLDGSPANSEDNTVKKGEVTVIGYGAKFDSPKGATNTTVNKSGNATPPLYILNGKEISDKEMKKLDPNSIKSINVLKDKFATEKYGEKGANGVLEITLKEQ